MKLALWVLILFSHNLFAQSSFLPQNMGATINSEYSEINPIISPDGKVLYFNRVNHPENTYGEFNSQDVWMSSLQEDSSWSTAVRLPSTINRERNNAILSITENGNAILINGMFYKNSTWKKRGISICRKSETEAWGAPEKLKIKAYGRKNQGAASNAYLSNDGQVLVLSCTRRWNGKKNHLFVSKKNQKGNWSSPKKIKKPVSTRFREEAPFLSDDGITLYFTSNRKNGKGEYDIYSCSRMDESFRKWSQPTLLSDTINSTQYESYYKTNLQGSWAYFCSAKNSLGNSDIYKVKIYEENPYVLVSGKIINKTTGDPLLGKSSYSIMINHEVVDSLKVDPQTAEYSFHLPLNKKYTIEGSVKNYISFPETVDVSGVREYSRVTQNLMIESYPYILLKGKLLVKDSHSPIPESANPTVWVNDTPIDSAIIHPDGSYELKIAFGKSYSLKAVAEKFNPFSQQLDLTAITEYKEMELDLFVNTMKTNIAVIQGKIIDAKTNQPFTSTYPFFIQVNGVNHHAQINIDSSTYKIELDLGKDYVINASAANYYPVFESIGMRTATLRITLNKNLYISPIEVGQTVKLNNIFFASGKTILKKESYSELDKVATFLQDNPGIIIEIGGHTDNVGNAAGNLKLSQGRAFSVEAYLESKGIAIDRIESKGYGITKPVADNATKAGKASNRRVEFTILGK